MRLSISKPTTALADSEQETACKSTVDIPRERAIFEHMQTPACLRVQRHARYTHKHTDSDKEAAVVLYPVKERKTERTRDQDEGRRTSYRSMHAEQRREISSSPEPSSLPSPASQYAPYSPSTHATSWEQTPHLSLGPHRQKKPNWQGPIELRAASCFLFC